MILGRFSFTAAILLFLGLCNVSYAQRVTPQQAMARWVDSVYSQLSDTERIGQLFMVAAYSGGKDYNEEKIAKLLTDRRIGGLIFMQGTPEAQAFQTNRFQQMAQVPLLIAMDAEWGLGMRLTGVKDLPRQMMIGATRDTALAYRMGVAVAAQCKRLGVHINFAPVVDVNNNPNNPIINARSFGEDKKWVAKLGIAYMKGMQDNGVMACAKHFPGHGDTETDSHKDLPAIPKSIAQLDTLELYPFKELIKAGIQSMMVAHLEVPALEPEPRIPTTLSKSTITNFLKSRMGFKGLVFTDALNMDGIAKHFAPGDVDLRAFIAGNDMLLFSQDVPTAINRVKAAILDGRIKEAELEQRVKKILTAKYQYGLNNRKPVDVNNITADINRNTNPVRMRMAEAGITLVRDRNDVLNKLKKKEARISYIGVNASGNSVLYQQVLEQFGPVTANWLPKGSTESAANKIMDSTANNDVTVVGVHNLAFYPGSTGRHGMDMQQVSFLTKMQSRTDVVILLMGNAYLMKNFCDVNSLIVGYEDDTITQQVAAKILFGQRIAKGKLPVTACDMSPLIVASDPKPAAVLTKSDFVQDAGVINPAALDKLNIYLNRCVVDGVFPGCRVLASKSGKVFYDESIGYLDYSKKQRVNGNTIYDVASLTKVLATTIAVMRLYETGKLDINKKLGDYLPWTKNSDKANILLKDLLLHQAGLKSWIPFYKETLNEQGNLRSDLYAKQRDATFTNEVAKDLWLSKTYVDTIWRKILASPLENKGKYVYSDLDYYFLAAVVQQITGQSIDKYVEGQFYRPMGLQRIAYNPLKRFPASEIAPTENDIIFRHQLVSGYVHDPGAAMFGGIAGHAGIFATANDVAAIFQMLVSDGKYGGKTYFTKETVKYFTAYNSRISRRALGFDKPSADKEDGGPSSNHASGYTFGHQGFTGTCAWADPASGVVFVFLSNRVNPSAENGKINKQNVRTVAQDYIYEALGIAIDRGREEVQRTQLANSK